MIKSGQIQRPQLVLVVDDQEINRDALGVILEDRYEVIYAENGQEAMEQMYAQIYRDAAAHNRNSCLYRHHIATELEKQKWYPAALPYEETDPHDLTVDFIAAMTDDYFVDYYRELFPKSPYQIAYIGYFD